MTMTSERPQVTGPANPARPIRRPWTVSTIAVNGALLLATAYTLLPV